MKPLLLTLLICFITLTAFAQDTALVKRVIDGDTIELANGKRGGL